MISFIIVFGNFILDVLSVPILGLTWANIFYFALFIAAILIAVNRIKG